MSDLVFASGRLPVPSGTMAREADVSRFPVHPGGEQAYERSEY